MIIKTPKRNNQSRLVNDFETVKADAKAMTKVLLTYRAPGKNGKGPNQHFALHHSQYSDSPYNFFVMNPLLFGENENQILVVANPKIIEEIGDRKVVREACMSFPFRPDCKVRRYSKIKVTYQAPAEDGKTFEDREDVVEDMIAQIFQHEIEHARGTHIYDPKK